MDQNNIGVIANESYTLKKIDNATGKLVEVIEVRYEGDKLVLRRDVTDPAELQEYE
jgi:hypothetical protein